MRGIILGVAIATWATWALLVFSVIPGIRRQGLETRRLVVELAAAKRLGPMHEHEIRMDDQLCVTNVVEDGKVVWER